MPTIANLKSKVDALQQLLEIPNVKDAAWQLALYDAVEHVAEYSPKHGYLPVSAESYEFVPQREIDVSLRRLAKHHESPTVCM